MKEYINGIYPRKLWIYKVGESDKFKDNFTLSDDGEDINPSSDIIGYDAIVYNVHHSSQGYGVLLCIKNNLSHRQIAHEATHAALEIFKDCDCRIDYDNQEPFAYLVGWVYECLDDFNSKL